MLTFHKNERLCRKKIIDSLFAQGHSFICYPFRIVWTVAQIETDSPVQVAFTVKKKDFKHAVDRNKLKRRMREAYRKNKQQLYDFFASKNSRLAFMVIYLDKQLLDYSQIEQKIISSLVRLEKELDTHFKWKAENESK